MGEFHQDGQKGGHSHLMEAADKQRFFHNILFYNIISGLWLLVT